MYQIFLITILFNYLFNFCLSISLFTQSQNKLSYTGYATTYDGHITTGSCGFKYNSIQQADLLSYPFSVAINSQQYNNSLSCGTCINIKYHDQLLQQTTQQLESSLIIESNIINNLNVIVSDICPECLYGDLDLFQASYNKLISGNPDKKLISWSFIDCPDNIISNNIQLRIDELNDYWLSIQPENFKCQIIEMYIFQNNNCIILERNDNIMTGLFFIYNKKKLETPFKFKIINKYYEEIISSEYNNLSHLFILNEQFKCELSIEC